MANSSSTIDARALCAMVAYHLNTVGDNAQFTDFERDPDSALWSRIQENQTITVRSDDEYANGLLSGFELGIEAAAAVVDGPLSAQNHAMREIVAFAIERIRTHREGLVAPVAAK